MKLKDKVAIVTGAGSGIGREIAREYAREGAKVVVSDFMKETGEETINLIKKEGGTAIFVQADSSKEADVENLMNSTVSSFGKIDILVNNAGIGGTLSSMNEITVDEWDQVMALNLKGPFIAAKKALPYMIKNGKGNIINVASMASFAAGRGGLAYTAAKHGLLGFTRQMSFMHGAQGIRTNAICPGPIETAMIQRVLEMPQHPLNMKIKASPAGRPGKPEGVAKLALFLASDDSEFIHGAACQIDGGYTIF
ncbi:MAG TPA: glucose 1-dehydrogenase [Spirochaetota bacterium]|nr:glucose 1-dehydrogenase [Spirochaetota bacterium]